MYFTVVTAFLAKGIPEITGSMFNIAPQLSREVFVKKPITFGTLRPSEPKVFTFERK